MARESAEEMKRKKDYAKLLFLSGGDLSRKEIADRAGVTEKTLRAWIADELWESFKTSLVTAKSDILRRMYAINQAVIEKIEKTAGGYGDTKLADMSIKYTAAIRNLETETSAGQLFELGIAFIRFVQKVNLKDAKLITEYFDVFIQDQVNNKF